MDLNKVRKLLVWVLTITLNFGCIVEEACEKNYLLTGRVEANGTPLSDVVISWRDSEDQFSQTTDINGVYMIPYKTRATLQDGMLRFSKEGFTSKTVPPFTASEAGNNICGSRTLVRDVQLEP